MEVCKIPRSFPHERSLAFSKAGSDQEFVSDCILASFEANQLGPGDGLARCLQQQVA